MEQENINMQIKGILILKIFLFSSIIHRKVYLVSIASSHPLRDFKEVTSATNFALHCSFTINSAINSNNNVPIITLFSHNKHNTFNINMHMYIQIHNSHQFLTLLLIISSNVHSVKSITSPSSSIVIIKKINDEKLKK